MTFVDLQIMAHVGELSVTQVAGMSTEAAPRLKV